MTNNILIHNNGRIYYEVAGSGEAIVLIHGFSLDHRMWQPQTEFFSKNHQVITYDVRGFGKSSLPKHPYNHAADLRALLDHLNIQRAHLVGLSMGGRIATNVAITYPDMVKTLVLMDAALEGYPSEVDWDVHAKEEGLENAKKNWLSHELFSTSSPKVIAALSLIVKDYSGWHWLHNDIQEPAAIPARERLKEISKPTLIIVGEKDLSYFHNIAQVLATGIPGAQKVIVPDVGHMVNMEAPERVNKLLADFIRSNE